jgi:ubiquinone/menaquinone biosynthesis C-methylase UbiE
MTGSKTPTPSAPNRAAWVLNLRRLNEREEDALAPVYDERWGEIEDTHRAFVERFLSMTPPDGKVLDAACGTGNYFGMVLAGGRSVLGVDHASAYLAVAGAKFPQISTEKYDLQDLPYRQEFDGVMCVDAMEMIPPEDWPIVLRLFRRALRPMGWLYMTVERCAEDEVRALNEEARVRGLPVVNGEVLWEESGYHYYPPMDRVRDWVVRAGFDIEDEGEGPGQEGYAYHHVLSRVQAIKEP